MLSRFLAFRIGTTGDTAARVSRPAVRISIAGVAIGLAVMIVSVGIVLGFKHTIRNKVTGFAGHVQVGDFLALQTGEPQPIQLNDSVMHLLDSIDGVAHVQRFATKQGLLKTDSDFLGVMFKGVGPEFDTLFISQHLEEGRVPVFSDEKSQSLLVVSASMARKLHLKAGERVFAYFIDEKGVRPRRFTIAGIYNTHLSQYDDNVCFTDIYTMQRLYGWQTDQVLGAEVRLDDEGRLPEVSSYIINKVNRTEDAYGATYSSRTVRELNPQIYYWLDLLDMNVWVILALMVAVAGVTMISGLLIIILERTSMIGVLKALGARNRTIRHTFLWLSVLIIGKGLLWGNAIGLALLALQHFMGVVKLNPEVYYVSTLPVEINFFYLVLLNVLTLVACLLVLILPSHFIAFIHPAKTMKFE